MVIVGEEGRWLPFAAWAGLLLLLAVKVMIISDGLQGL
jgi:hypothetical protein